MGRVSVEMIRVVQILVAVDNIFENTMKAVQLTRYGGPDAFEVVEVPTRNCPSPAFAAFP